MLIKTKQITIILLIFVALVIPQTSNANNEKTEKLQLYYDHVYKIGVIEELAGDLLNKYQHEIDNLVANEEAINQFRVLVASFQDILKEHRRLEPPNKHIKLHHLFTDILETHIIGFKKLVLGLEQKKISYVNESFNIFETVNNDMDKADKIMGSISSVFQK